MPSGFTHLFVAGALGKTYTEKKMPLRFWLLSGACAVLPDIDVIGYYLGIKYGDIFGHRGFFHSLSFALITGVLVVVIAFPGLRRFSRQWWGLATYFFVVTASHGFLDSMTDKGMGVGFFIPFDNTRYFMPWRPIYASPMRISQLFGPMGFDVLIREILWIWVPVTVLFAAASLVRKKAGRGPAVDP